MHLIIVEDLDLDRNRLAELIRQDCACQGENADISFYACGEAFLAGYRPKSCDGLFLDILLGGLSGIEIARKIREAEPRLPIIFTTTERDYAVEGFDVHATDYLIKPVAPERVSWCMKKLRERMSAPSSILLLETCGRGHSAPVAVALDEILYGQYFDHAVAVRTLNREYRTRASFQDFTAQLPHTGRFYVCGRGLVVNLSQVVRVETDTMLLKNGERLSFSRRRRQEIQKAYAEWTFACSREGGWA